MTQPTKPRQLTRAEVADLGRQDPEALNAARLRGELADVLAGREPGEPRTCPTCHRPEDPAVV